MYTATEITRNRIVLFYHTLGSQNLSSKVPVSSLAVFELQMYFAIRLILCSTCVKRQNCNTETNDFLRLTYSVPLYRPGHENHVNIKW